MGKGKVSSLGPMEKKKGTKENLSSGVIVVEVELDRSWLRISMCDEELPFAFCVCSYPRNHPLGSIYT